VGRQLDLADQIEDLSQMANFAGSNIDQMANFAGQIVAGRRMIDQTERLVQIVDQTLVDRTRNHADVDRTRNHADQTVNHAD